RDEHKIMWIGVEQRISTSSSEMEQEIIAHYFSRIYGIIASINEYFIFRGKMPDKILAPGEIAEHIPMQLARMQKCHSTFGIWLVSGESIGKDVSLYNQQCASRPDYPLTAHLPCERRRSVARRQNIKMMR